MSKELAAAAKDFEDHVKTAARDTMASDAMDLVGFAESAINRGENASWHFWPTWGDRYPDCFLEVDEGRWRVSTQDADIRSAEGTDIRKLKQWFWEAFNIGESRGLSWDRER